MFRSRILSLSLALLVSILSFNAYACLLPIYDGWGTGMESDCMGAAGQPDRDYCDTFRSMGIHASSLLQAQPDWHAMVPMLSHETGLSVWSPKGFSPAHRPAPPPRDLLVMISVFRI